jgi:dTDP-L-rhamnose 4-epimerase
MNVLVTGGAGFIGTRLVKALAGVANVVVVDSLDPQVHPRPRFDDSLQNIARCIKADIRHPHTYRDEIGPVDVLVHLAAQTGTAQSMYETHRYVSHNVDGTAALLDMLHSDNTLKRVVVASSRAVYGEGLIESASGVHPARRHASDMRAEKWRAQGADGRDGTPLPMRYGQPEHPTSLYGLTKLWQEQLVRLSCSTRGIDQVILRLHNVFGPGQAASNPYTGIVAHIMRQVAADDEVELFEDGLVTRDFIFVDDVVHAIALVVIAQDELQATYDIGSGVATSLKRLVEVAGEVTGRMPKARISGRSRVGDIRHAVADIASFTRRFPSFTPIDLAAGLEQYHASRCDDLAGDKSSHQRSLDELEVRGLLLTSRSTIS